MKEDSILLGQIEDKICQCEDQYRVSYTGFLDSHQQSVARSFCSKIHDKDMKIHFCGGYEDADRVIMLCLPDYEELADCLPFTVIRVERKEGGRPLAHGDYLGSLLGLGIKREKIGDILVREGGADIIVMEDIADFILTNYTKAGRTYVFTGRVCISALEIPEKKREIIRDSVASMRLDSVVASAFRLSRGKAAAAICSGVVLVNHVESTKIDATVHEGDAIVLRGRGKVVVKETAGTSRKGRQVIVIERFC